MGSIAPTGKLFLLLMIIGTVHSGLANSNTGKWCGYTIILLGSTGDLAKRYIWPALFENFLHLDVLRDEDYEEHQLMIFGGSRSKIVDREKTLAKLLANVKCQQSNSMCTRSLQTFKDLLKFIQVRTANDYEKLAEMVKITYKTDNRRECGRMVYLSIPPSAYASTIEQVSTHLKPTTDKTWLRVVLEKPFGQNLSSALQLNHVVSKYLQESQVYRIDHYLGKFGVQIVSSFLTLNSELLRSIWNNNGIQSMEIAIEETLDTSGRSNFYDANGVIRDVHQNHLTEILAIVLMDPMSNHQTKKVDALSRLLPPRLHHTVLGQYADYQRHLEEDGILKQSNTPTYASVTLQSMHPKWKGVAFILTSGKQLKQKTAFIRVLFKHRIFPSWGMKTSCFPEIRFLIQQAGIKPGIILSEHFSRLALNLPTSSNWTEKLFTDPESTCVFTHFESDVNINSNSYISLINAVLNGQKEYFVDSESLLESWRIWTPLLEEIETTLPKPILYTPDNLQVLEFAMHGSKLATFTHTEEYPSLFQGVPIFSSNATTLEDKLFDHKTVIANKYQLSSLLAKHLYKFVLESIDVHRSFHIALPGGSSHLLLLNTLSLDYQHLFPWEHIHIWQIDERCVLPTNKHSNLQLLSKHLLLNVPIPHLNIHPMPVSLQQGVCISEDNGASLYERQLTELVPNGRLDYVLLGVGSDGHIASLYQSREQASSDEQVMVLESNEADYIQRRITLTLNCILKSQRIGLLFVGNNKKEIVRTVQRCLIDNKKVKSCEELPVMKLIYKAQREQLTLYIDSELL